MYQPISVPMGLVIVKQGEHTRCPPRSMNDSSPAFWESDIGRSGCGDDVFTRCGGANAFELRRAGGTAFGSSGICGNEGSFPSAFN